VTRVLVTGSSGFIGSHLISYFEKKDLNYITFIDRLNSDYQLSDYVGFSVVVHLAGLAHNKGATEDEVKDINFKSTMELAKKAKELGVCKFIFLSSITVYGILDGRCISELTPPMPITAFSKSKYQAELGLKALETSDFEIVIIRSPLVYGRGAQANFDLLLKLVSASPILPFGLINNSRSYIAVSNLVDFILHCIKNPKAGGETFLVSDGICVSTQDFTNAIAEGIDKRVFQLPIPHWLMNFFAKLVGKPEISKQLFGNLWLDCSKNRRLLGWKPPLTMAQAMKSLR
jgi:nucleoside-diphosphate-sugar epimerase